MVEIRLRSIGLRLLIPVLATAAVLLVWPRLKLQTDAYRLSGSTRLEDLTASLRLDPRQPEVERQLGLFYLYDPALLDAAQAVDHFEAALLLAPFDFNLWVNLGQAYEQRGELKKAAASFQMAIRLAPQYFLPHWIYANFLLRRGEADEAFSEFGFLAERNLDAIDNICQLIWEASEGNVERLVRFGEQLETDRARQGVCRFLLRFGHTEQAIALWQHMVARRSSFVAGEKAPVHDQRFRTSDQPTIPAWRLTGNEIISNLLSARDFNRAHSVWLQLLEAEGQQPTRELIWNGDFEVASDLPSSPGFDWQIKSTDEVKAAVTDLESKTGRHSLLLDFQKHERVAYAGVSHYVKVEPNQTYRLSFSYKTRDMLAGSGIYVEVVDAEDNRRLSLTSEELGNETDWTEKHIAFQTPSETRFLILRLVRRPSESLYDFVKGRIWFDAFELAHSPHSRGVWESRASPTLMTQRGKRCD